MPHFTMPVHAMPATRDLSRASGVCAGFVGVFTRLERGKSGATLLRVLVAVMSRARNAAIGMELELHEPHDDAESLDALVQRADRCAGLPAAVDAMCGAAIRMGRLRS